MHLGRFLHFSRKVVGVTLITEHQPDKLCFLSEENMFSLIVDLNKTILAAFITRLVRHPEKQN